MKFILFLLVVNNFVSSVAAASAARVNHDSLRKRCTSTYKKISRRKIFDFLGKMHEFVGERDKEKDIIGFLRVEV